MKNKSSNSLKSKARVYFFLFLAFCLSEATVSAAAPVNDNFASAQTISGNSGSITATNLQATKETGEQAHALNRGGASVWYKFVAPGSGVLRVDTAGSSFNTLLAVYSGTNLNNLTLVSANDEDGSNGSSRVYFGTQSGATYYIAVDGKFNEGNGVASGSGLKLNYSFENAMPNDNFANAIQLRNDLPINSAAFTNVGASKEVGEPNHSNNAGGRSVWFKWQAPDATPRRYTFTLDQKSVANPNAGITPLFQIYTGSSVNSLLFVARHGGTRVGRLSFVPQPGVTYYIVVDGYDFGAGAGAQLGNFMLTVNVAKSQKNPDFDRDGRADISVYRPTTGTFYSLNSADDSFRGFQWGVNGDKPLFSEVDSDAKTDYLVFRPDTQAWYTHRSYNGAFTGFNWGINTDVPLIINQYDTIGGGLYNFATVFRQSTGTWWIYRNGFDAISMQFGQNGDVPLTFDYDGDGADEIVVFRPSNGTWYLANPFTGQFTGAYKFGQNGDVPVPADYDGDGMADLAIYRPSTGTWWFRDRQTGAQTARQFGIASDKPQPADYDGDGQADLAVFRSGVWYILQSSNGAARGISFGLGTDIPVSAPVN